MVTFIFYKLYFSIFTYLQGSYRYITECSISPHLTQVWHTVQEMDLYEAVTFHQRMNLYLYNIINLSPYHT